MNVKHMHPIMTSLSTKYILRYGYVLYN